MANLIINNACNLSCPFCFASEYHADAAACAGERMSFETFERLVEFSGEETVRLCGGEPSLHPDFIRMLEHILDKPERNAFVMTNGVWPTPVQRYVEALPRAKRLRLGFLINALEPDLYGAGQEQRLHDTLVVLPRDRVVLGVTIFRGDYDFRHLFTLARRYRMRRLRYSVASPNVTDTSSWHLNTQKDFRAISDIVYGLVMQARELGMQVTSDCGYVPPCMFSEGQLQNLYPEPGAEAVEAFSCGGPVDIGADGEAWRCYGLYSVVRADTGDFNNAAELGAHFERETAHLYRHHLFDDCATCTLKERYPCAGGCYAKRAVRDMRQRGEQAGVRLEDPEAFAAALPTCRSDTVHIIEGLPPIVMLRGADEAWRRVHLSTLELALLRACDGHTCVHELVDKAAATRPKLRPAAESALRRLFQQNMIALKPGTPARRRLRVLPAA